ncbi:MAG: hypothetical protein QXV55_00625 [Acidilobaceae archaeon]
MAKDPGEEQRHSEVRREAIKVLQILSRFYSYRVLERVYGVHFQNLWRYANLLSVPERETAEKIVEKTRELRLLEKALKERVSQSLANGGLHVLLRDTGFLQLVSHIASQMLKDERDSGIDAVIAMSYESLPLATVLAIEFEADVCVVSDRIKAEPKGILATHFRSPSSGEVFSVLVPKQCLDNGNGVILVEAELKDVSKISALLSMAKKTGTRVIALVALKTAKEALEELKKGAEKVEVVEVLSDFHEG